MIDIKDTNTIIDSLRRCCHAGSYADTDLGETCDGCAYYEKCCDLELDTAELILLLDDLTDHQFKINHDAIIVLRHCNGCSAAGYSSRCLAHNMYGSNGCDKIQEDAANILEKMYSRCMAGPVCHVAANPYEDYDTKTIHAEIKGCDGFRNGKIPDIYYSVGRGNGKSFASEILFREDILDAMAYTSWITEFIEKTYKANQADEWRRHFEYPLTPKSIEQSADHKTVVVIWQDGSKTVVKLSENDSDDINTAFAYALAKKVFGTNTHLKKVVREKLNVHKTKLKKETKDATGR